MHSNDFENDFENEPLFAPISKNELTSEAVSDPLKQAEKGGGDTGIEISGENMLERGKEIEAIIGNNYVESVMRIQLAEFTAPQDVANPSGSYLSMIMMITKERMIIANKVITPPDVSLVICKMNQSMVMMWSL